ncbi:MAG: 50S ribosomal protein L33 [Gammaproteobacteria bacterium]
MAGKGREKISLKSEGKTKKGNSTGTFRTTTTNKAAMTANKKLEIKKFDKRAYNEKTGRNGMHVIFKQTKLK